MKGSANAAWNGVVKPSGPTQKYGDRDKSRRGGAPEGAPAGNAAGGRLRWGARRYLRRFGAPPPSFLREQEEKALAPRHTTKGADETRLKKETGSCAGARAVWCGSTNLRRHGRA